VTVSPDTAELSYIDAHAARIAHVEQGLIDYRPTYHQESWGFSWWHGSNQPAPDLVLNTSDPWGASWD